jgi:hypothetical protein
MGVTFFEGVQVGLTGGQSLSVSGAGGYGSSGGGGRAWRQKSESRSRRMWPCEQKTPKGVMGVAFVEGVQVGLTGGQSLSVSGAGGHGSSGGGGRAWRQKSESRSRQMCAEDEILLHGMPSGTCASIWVESWVRV